MATQVTMEDGTKSPLVDHMRDAHQKGTSGFTEEYLDSLHRSLHQRKREPEEELEHRHPSASGAPDTPGAPGDPSALGAQEDRAGSGEQRSSEAMNANSRDREEQGMPETMKTKNRNQQHTSESGNGQHRDRYEQRAPGVPDQRSRDPQQDTRAPQSPNAERRTENPNAERHDREEAVAPAGGQQRGGNGKHRKNRH